MPSGQFATRHEAIGGAELQALAVRTLKRSTATLALQAFEWIGDTQSKRGAFDNFAVERHVVRYDSPAPGRESLQNGKRCANINAVAQDVILA
jgi:hypothetical protein